MKSIVVAVALAASTVGWDCQADRAQTGATQATESSPVAIASATSAPTSAATVATPPAPTTITATTIATATQTAPTPGDDLAARKAALSPEQFAVTQQGATEPPFHNAFWNQHAPGIYVDVVSGEPLFSSRDKFDSGTGWPSFTAPLEKANLEERADDSNGDARTEVRSTRAGSHLGHVFADGPGPTGLRYCIDSAALRFVPAERLQLEGYGQYASLFPEVTQLSP